MEATLAQQAALSDSSIDEIVQDAVVWANQHGLVRMLACACMLSVRNVMHAACAAAQL